MKRQKVPLSDRRLGYGGSISMEGGSGCKLGILSPSPATAFSKFDRRDERCASACQSAAHLPSGRVLPVGALWRYRARALVARYYRASLIRDTPPHHLLIYSSGGHELHWLNVSAILGSGFCRGCLRSKAFVCRNSYSLSSLSCRCLGERTRVLMRLWAQCLAR